ncbi:hypothetical protein TB1_000925 [Malus domestica]
MWAALSRPLFSTPEEAQARPHPPQHCLPPTVVEPAVARQTQPLGRGSKKPSPKPHPTVPPLPEASSLPTNSSTKELAGDRPLFFLQHAFKGLSCNTSFVINKSAPSLAFVPPPAVHAT